MGQLTGRAFITVAGKRLASKEGAKLGFGNLERTAELGDQGVLGYKEKPTVPFVECTVEHSADMSLQEFADMVDVTTYHVGMARHMDVFREVKNRLVPREGYAWTRIGVSELAHPGLLVEIKCVAHRPGG